MADRNLRAPVPFQPDESQLEHMPLFKANLVPRYLFRVHSPTTVGTTCPSCVVPPSVHSTEPKDSEDIFSLPKDEAADRLNEHLRWDHDHEKKCNLMSWSSSLLFVLQYGLFKHLGSWKPSGLSDINLMILDTHDLPPRTFVKDMELLEVFAPYSFGSYTSLTSFLGLRTRRDRIFYFGEYLNQGDVDLTGNCAQVSMQELIDLGLFELIPELSTRTNWQNWANIVLDLRQPFKRRMYQDTTRDEVCKAIQLARDAFGVPWAVPVAAMLLALKPRMSGDSIIIDGFESMFSPDELDRAGLGDIYIDDDRLPEVKQFKALIRDIHEHIDIEEHLDTDDDRDSGEDRDTDEDHDSDDDRDIVGSPVRQDAEEPLVDDFKGLQINK